MWPTSCSSSLSDYRIDDSILTIPKEKETKSIKAPHGWKWAQTPKDFYMVNKRKVYSKEPFQGAAAWGPDLVAPFSSLSIKKDQSTLRNGKKRRVNQEPKILVEDPATIANLEDCLPSECFPDILEVQTNSICSIKAGPFIYQRAVPGPWVDHDPMSCLPKSQKSILSLWQDLGKGGHGTVFRALLSLPEPYQTIHGDNVVNVAAKFASNDLGAKKHLGTEADAYSLLSRSSRNFLQKDWTGYVACTGKYGSLDEQICRYLQPTSAPLKAVVPRFFGLYKPMNDDSEMDQLLLIEDCGHSIISLSTSGDLPQDQAIQAKISSELQAQIPAMYASLHRAGFLQCSVKLENIAIQPGPLHLPFVERDYATPSFRVLDFGRTSIRQDLDKENEFSGTVLSKDEFENQAHIQLSKVFNICS